MESGLGRSLRKGKRDGGVIPDAPSEDAYRTDLAEAALALVEGDATGESWTPVTVELREGGE